MYVYMYVYVCTHTHHALVSFSSFLRYTTHSSFNTCALFFSNCVCVCGCVCARCVREREVCVCVRVYGDAHSLTYHKME